MDGDVLYQDTEYITIFNVDNNRKYKINYNGTEYDVATDNSSIIFKLPTVNLSNAISVRVYNNQGEYLESTNTLELIPIQHDTLDNEKLADIRDEVTKFEGEINKSVVELHNKIEFLSSNLNKDNTQNFKNITEHFEKEIEDVINLINNLDFYNKNYIDNLPFLKEQDLAEIKIQYQNLSKDFNIFISNLSDYDNTKEIENMTKQVTDLQVALTSLTQKINSINISIVSFNNFMDKYQKDYTKLEEKYSGIYTSYIELQSLKIPISSEEPIEPFIFLDIIDGKFKPYSYNVKRRPIGVSDDNGNLIYHGFAKVKYQNEIHIGDFVYGNKEGLAENYNSGFIVTEINSDKMCTVFIS